jgi:hypothetical protein
MAAITKRAPYSNQPRYAHKREQAILRRHDDRPENTARRSSLIVNARCPHLVVAAKGISMLFRSGTTKILFNH